MFIGYGFALTAAFLAAIVIGTYFVAGPSSPFVPGVTLFAGAAIAFLATYFHEERRRQAEARDLSVALYEEIADRAARCCCDYRAPWQFYRRDALDAPSSTLSGTMGRMNVFRMRKFRPAAPVIFPGIAAKIGLINSNSIGPVMHFYFRLDAWRRDIESFSTQDLQTELEPSACHLLAHRLWETLGPALNALEQLGMGIDEAQVVDRRAMASYSDDTEGLRDTLRALVQVRA